MHEALCRSSGTTLDSVHAEDGPPITQRTSGLDVFLECVPEYDAHANLVILATDVVDHLAESAAPKLNHQIFRDIAAMLDIWAANDLAAFEAMRQPPFERPNQ
jgi:hypothetical protein